MTAIRLKKGEVVELQEKTYVVTQRLADMKIRLENATTGAVVTLTDAKIASYHARRELKLLPSADMNPARQAMLGMSFSAMPEKVQKAALRAKEYVDEFDLAEKGSLSAENLQPIIARVAARREEDPPCWTTLRNWIRHRERAGTDDVRVFAPAIHRRGNTDRRFKNEYYLEIEDRVLTQYLTRGNFSQVDIWKALVAEIAVFNKASGKLPLSAPSRRAISDRLRKFDKYVVMKARQGKRAADLRHRPVERGLQASRPGEWILVDHTKVDLLLIDFERGVPLGRPWITAAIDAYSRAIWGVHVSFEPPSALVSMNCLKNGFLSKDYVSDFTMVRHQWDVYGGIESVLLDNGPEFHSAALEAAAYSCQFKVHHAPVRAPWFKGMIERWFGTLNSQLLHTVPGTTLSSPAKLGDRKPRDEACIGFDLFRHLLHKWLVDEYLRQPHEGITDVPIHRWTDGVERLGGLPLPPMSAIDELVGGYAMRTVRRGGVEIFGHVYNVGDLPALAARPDFDARVEVRYDQADISQVLVKDPRRGRLVPVGIQRGYEEYARDLPLHAHRVIRAHARATMNDRTDLEALCLARAELRRMVDQAFGRRRVSPGIKAARFEGVGAKALAGRMGHVTDAAHAKGAVAELMGPEDEDGAPADTPAAAPRRRARRAAPDVEAQHQDDFPPVPTAASPPPRPETADDDLDAAAAALGIRSEIRPMDSNKEE